MPWIIGHGLLVHCKWGGENTYCKNSTTMMATSKHFWHITILNHRQPVKDITLLVFLSEVVMDKSIYLPLQIVRTLNKHCFEHMHRFLPLPSNKWYVCSGMEMIDSIMTLKNQYALYLSTIASSLDSQRTKCLFWKCQWICQEVVWSLYSVCMVDETWRIMDNVWPCEAFERLDGNGVLCVW